MKLFIGTGFLISVVLLASILVVAQTQKSDVGFKNKISSRVSVKYEKSKDQTTVRLKQFTITRWDQEKQIANNIPLHQMDLEASFTYEGRELKKPVQDVTLRFHAVAGNYIFLKGQEIIAALDIETPGRDRAMRLGMTDYKSLAPKFNSVYEEYMTVVFPASAFQKMAKAESLKLLAGPVMYSLTSEQLNDLRDFAELLTPEAIPTNTGN